MHQNPLFLRFSSFKVIDVGTPGKLVSSACCDSQQVCATILTLDDLMAVN